MFFDKAFLFIEETTSITKDSQVKILLSILILAVILVIRFFVARAVWKRTDDPRTRYTWGKTISYTAYGVIVVAVGSVWFRNLGGLHTYLGLVSAGIAIALKDPITNLTGWLFIIARSPFGVGDRIQIGSDKGDVIDIRPFQFALLEIGNWVDSEQSTGRIINIPNGKVFTDTLANYTKGFRFIWNEIPVVVTFESDWKKAKKILTEIVESDSETLSEVAAERIKEASKSFMIFYRQLTPIVYTRVIDIGVELTIRYLCRPRARRGSEEKVWESILEHFAEHEDISFAYPTTRFYTSDGKDKPPNGASANNQFPL